MKIQAITSFGKLSVNNTTNTNNQKPKIHRYKEPLTDAYFYYDEITGTKIPCDTFMSTMKKKSEKKTDKRTLSDMIVEYWGM